MKRLLMVLALVGMATGAGTQGIDYRPGAHSTPYYVHDGYGGYLEYGVNTELLTIEAAATTDTVTSILPADSLILAVTARVVTVIPTAATFSAGDATTAARFWAGMSTAAGTVTTGAVNGNQCNYTANSNAGSCVQAAAAKIRITPNAQPAAATGTVRIVVYYRKYVAPTQ